MGPNTSGMTEAGAQPLDIDSLFDGVNDTSAEEVNIARKMKQEELDTIGSRVVESFNADIDSRTDFDKRRASWLKMFAGYRDPKDYPWPKASNTHLPFILVACLQFQARAYEALLGKDIVKCFTRDGLQRDAAKRTENYMNYQLRFEMTDWEEDMDKLLMALPVDGFVVKKTYPDYETKQPVSKFLTVDEFVVNYKARSLNDPRLRKTHIIWKEIDKIEDLQDQKVFLKPEGLVLSPEDSRTDGNTPETKNAQDKIEGSQEPDAEFTNKRKLLEQHVYLDINYNYKEKKLKQKDGKFRPYIVTVDYTSEKVLRIVSRLSWDEDHSRDKVEEYFTGYSFIPNPNSVYAFGFGQLLDHMNEAADTALNQLLDAGHLNNIIAGFINKRAGLKKGDMGFEMGVFKEVDVMAPDIRNAIYQFQFKEPSRILFAVIGMLHDYVKETTTTSEWMSGGMPPSDTAATTMLAVIEQGLKVFSVIQKRLHRAFRQELRKIFDINHDVLDEKVYALVQDKTSREWKSIESGKKDFSSNVMIIPVSDPNITSRAEKLIKSQQALAEVKTYQPGPQTEMALYAARQDYFESMEAPNIEQINPKPQPPPPPPDLPPEVENNMLIKDTITPALPTQNHHEHVTVHDGFKASNWFEQLTPHGKKLHEAHVREHMGFLYLAEAQQHKQAAMQYQGGNFGSSTTGGMNG